MTSHWENFLLEKIKLHILETQSKYAKNILDNWKNEKYLFWQVVPKEMVTKFDQPIIIEEEKELKISL